MSKSEYEPLCYCGEYMKNHSNVFDSGHTAVQMPGCEKCEGGPLCGKCSGCDCGAHAVNTTHSDWCSTRKATADF